jgi:hypothetical protein
MVAKKWLRDDWSSIYLKDMPKKKPSKRYSRDIDGFIYYLKKLNGIQGVFHYPTGYLLFCEKHYNNLDMYIMENHSKIVELFNEFLQYKQKQSGMECIENDK